jgi:hypothetical protein
MEDRHDGGRAGLDITARNRSARLSRGGSYSCARGKRDEAATPILQRRRSSQRQQKDAGLPGRPIRHRCRPSAGPERRANRSADTKSAQARHGWDGGEGRDWRRATPSGDSAGIQSERLDHPGRRCGARRRNRNGFGRSLCALGHRSEAKHQSACCDGRSANR